jgi:hypothetical protein
MLDTHAIPNISPLTDGSLAKVFVIPLRTWPNGASIHLNYKMYQNTSNVGHTVTHAACPTPYNTRVIQHVVSYTLSSKRLCANKFTPTRLNENNQSSKSVTLERATAKPSTFEARTRLLRLASTCVTMRLLVSRCPYDSHPPIVWPRLWDHLMSNTHELILMVIPQAFSIPASSQRAHFEYGLTSGLRWAPHGSRNVMRRSACGSQAW